MLNNPLSLTDPTGYFFSGLFKATRNAFRAAFKAIGSAFRSVLKSAIGRAIIQIGVCVLDPIASCAAVAAGLTAAVGGSIEDAVKAVAFSLVQYGVWDQVGNALVNAAMTTKTLVHGVVGGALSVAQGGSFLQGFASAAIGQVTGTASELAFGPAGTGGEVGFAGRTAAAALGGGLAAELTGGKFGNGAITAAFARMFNDELHFDGRKLTAYSDDGKQLASWDAVSGRPGSTSDDQAKNDYGPIPEGEWSVDPSQSQAVFDFYKAWLKNGLWFSWGWARTPIAPKATTNTYGRWGFYIHGGTIPGSAGCIDLTFQNGSFHSWLGTQNKPVKLHVKYPGSES